MSEKLDKGWEKLDGFSYAQPPQMGRADGSMENYDRVGMMATNGKLEEQQEHGSDASETVSIQSGGSIPVVR